MHYEISSYSAACIFVSFFYHNGTLTTLLLLQFFLIHQYFYYCLFLEHQCEGEQVFCVQCDKMTNHTFIHCKECKRCVPVTHFHWYLFGRCVSRLHAKRYKDIVHLIIWTNIFCSVVESLTYVPFLFVSVLSFLVLKSTASKFNGII